MVAAYSSVDWTMYELDRLPDNRKMPLNHVAFGNGVFVATADEGEVFRVGGPQDVTLLEKIPDARLYGVAFGEGLFVLAGLDLARNQGVIFKSSNGEDWDRQLLNTSEALRGIVFGNGIFLAVGNDIIVRSDDAINWQVDTGTGLGFQTLNFLNGEFFGAKSIGVPIAVPEFVFLHSTDGEHWEESEPYRPPIGQIAFGRDRYLAVTQGYDCLPCPGPNLLSLDGRNWRRVPSQMDRNGLAAGYGNGMFVTSTRASGGTILNSGNALDWEEFEIPNSHHVRSFAFGEDRFVAVGPGVIMVSETIEFQPLISNVEIEGTELHFEFDGAEGTTWELQVAGDLVNWLKLAEFTKASTGFERFSTHTGRADIRYMRLRKK